jgi:CHAT domain-containing protein/lipopolysaccharide biosynthesis regulator YciM
MNLFQKLSLYLLTTAAIVTVLVKDTGAIITSRNPPRPSVGLFQQIAQTPDVRKTEADRLFLQGHDESVSRELRLQSMHEALKIYRQIKYREGELAVLMALANAYNTLGDYHKAIDYQQQILAIARELKNRFSEESALKSLGEIYYILEDYHKMIDYEQQLLAIIREPKQDDVCKFCEPKKDVFSERFALQRLEYAYRALGDYPNATSYQKQRLALEQETRSSDNGVSAVDSPPANNRVGETRKGEADRLLQQSTIDKQYELVTQLAEQVMTNPQNAALQPSLQVRLNTAFETRVATLKRSLEIYRQIKDRQGEKDALESLGNAYFSLAILGNQTSSDSPSPLIYLSSIQERLSKAIEYQQQSLAIARELKNPSDVEQSLADLSGTYGTLSGFSYILKDYSKVIDSQQKLLAIARELKYGILEGEALGSLGDVYYRLGEYNKAIDYHQQSLVIMREQNHPPGLESALSGLGRAYTALGEYNKAIDYHQQSLPIARELKSAEHIGRSLSDLGAAMEGVGRLPEAERNLLEAIAIWENLRDNLNLPPILEGNGYRAKIERDISKIQQLEVQSTTYRSLQRVLVTQNKMDAALEIAERGRARAFVELLAYRIQREGISSPVIPPISVAEIKQVAKTQNATLVEYSLVDTISDAFYDINGGGGVVEQKVRESALYVWVVQPTGDVAFRKVDLKPLLQQKNISLRDKVAQARQSIVKGVNIASRGNNITLTPGDRIKLKDDLPQWDAWEVLSVNPQKQTITVWLPSGGTGTKSDRPMTDVVEKVTNSASANAKNPQLQELYQLLIQPIADLLPKEETARVIFIPQDALFLVPFPALQDPSGQYLIDKHTILTAPSIQVLDSTNKLRQKVPGLAKDVLVVGNPTMPKVSKKPGEPPQQLSALPSSEKEALAIASFWKTQALIGNQATKKSVLKKIHDAKIIHLATHGLLDDIQGLGSSIVFAPEGQDNGLLTAEDILNLYAQPQGSALSAELVVLSACDTGSGRLTGDGVIGLSRSIIAAGVPSVIVSLWSIPDAPTAELMTYFYQNLQRQQDKATALRQAMLTTKKKHPNPADWAAFTLIGESE